ncbi:HtaA domain-containing protein [Corynebacterium kutscheri]|uniref:Htaa protein n=1 Tax=Corynebacterium kutscheri TaxID=35755 RepID=A0A0F6TES9_9CORY|nr:HtaA domain-containing protein [Corynebacterium kutscheri]AKE42049.1 Htaa protein [Corynebacterium kutscheri]VEH10390.1 cell-surface hemin receptor [Corynebacterium kutscheri]
MSTVARRILIPLISLALLPIAPVHANPAEGNLFWGIRASFNNYTGGPSAFLDGATATANGFKFPLESQSYDASQERMEAQFSGGVHYRKYCTDPTKPLEGFCHLDLKFSNPKVVIDDDGSYIEAMVSSRQYLSGETYAPKNPVKIVQLHTASARFSKKDGTINWSNIATSLTEEGLKMFSNFYNLNEGLDPVALTYTGEGERPSNDASALRVAEKTWDSPRDYDHLNRPFFIGNRILMSTAEFGFTLLDKKLNHIAQQEAPVSKLNIVALDPENGYLYYAAAEDGTSTVENRTAIWRVSVNDTGFGTPEIFKKTSKTIYALGVEPTTQKVFSVSLAGSSENDDTYFTVYDGNNTREVKLPAVNTLPGLSAATSGNPYVRLYDFYNELVEMAQMNDGTFLYAPGTEISTGENSRSTKGFMFSIDLNATADSELFKLMPGSTYSYTKKLTTINTDGTTIVRSIPHGGAQTLTYANRNVTAVNSITDTEATKDWAGAAFLDGEMIQLNGKTGTLNWMDPATFKVHRSIVLPNGRETSNRAHDDFLIAKNGTIYVQTLDESRKDHLEHLSYIRLHNPIPQPESDEELEKLKDLARREQERLERERLERERQHNKPSSEGSTNSSSSNTGSSEKGWFNLRTVLPVLFAVLGGLSFIAVAVNNHLRHFFR